MNTDPPVALRCTKIAFRDAEVLLVRRSTRRVWVLSGGRPRRREGVLGLHAVRTGHLIQPEAGVVRLCFGFHRRPTAHARCIAATSTG